MNRFFFSCKKKRALFSRVMVVLGILVMNVMGSYNDIILWEALAGDAPSIDVIVTLSYAPVHGSDDFLKAIEDEATFGR